MLTTSAMILIGKTYGNLMVDVNALGSEKLRDRARRIVHIVTGLDYDEADKLLKKAHWNVKVAIVMQKTGLTYAKARRAAAEVGRSDPRSDRRGHRAAPARADRRVAEPASRCARSSITVTRGMQLQERRRQPRRDQSFDHAVHRIGLLRAGRHQHDLPRAENRRHPHRQRALRHGGPVAAEPLRVGLRGSPARASRDVRVRAQSRRPAR